MDNSNNKMQQCTLVEPGSKGPVSASQLLRTPIATEERPPFPAQSKSSQDTSISEAARMKNVTDKNTTEEKTEDILQKDDQLKKGPVSASQLPRIPITTEKRPPLPALSKSSEDTSISEAAHIKNVTDKNTTEEKNEDILQKDEQPKKDGNTTMELVVSKTNYLCHHKTTNLTRVNKCKIICSRMETQRQGIRAYVCHVCKIVIWGQLKRYRQHIKLHRKLHPKPRKQSRKFDVDLQQNVPVVPKVNKPSIKQRLRKPKKTQHTSGSTQRPQSKMSHTSKGSVRHANRHNNSGKPADVNIERSGDNKKKDLYLCGKCCRGFTDVLKLVSHVTVCCGPQDQESVEMIESNGLVRNVRSRSRSKAISKKLNKVVNLDSLMQEHTVAATSKHRRRQQVSLQKIKHEVEDKDWMPAGSDSDESDNSDKIHHVKSERTCNKKKRGAHVCRVCGKSFTQSHALRRHALMHTAGPKSHQCPFCSKAFTQSSHLKRHKQNLHSSDSDKIKETVGKDPGGEGRKPKKDETESKDTVKQGKMNMRKLSNNPNHECPVCKKTFSHFSGLTRHKLIHTGVRRHKCDGCQMKFTQSCHLKSHIKKIHMRVDRDKLKCLYCEETFVYKKNLKVHMLSHPEQSPHECQVCKARFAEEGYLRRHMVRTHNNPDLEASLLMCNECGRTFSFLSSLKRHKLLHQDVKKFECEVCHRRFIQKYHYMNHKCTQHGSEEKSNLCMICGKSFASAYSMKKHEMSVHAATKDFKCPVCNKGFATSVHLKVHVGGAHGGGNHLCDQCGKSFSFKSSYFRHLKFHAGAKPYQCKYCERTFTQSSHCKGHELTHVDLEKRPCKYCGKKFKNPRNHKHHLKLHHQNETTYKCFRCETRCNTGEELAKHMEEKCNEANNNPACNYCSKVFPTHSHLVRHLRTHTNERPFACTMCTKSFTQKSHLKNHILRHSKIKAWQCEVCGRSYASREYLKHHVKKLHEERPDGGAEGAVDSRKKKRTDCELCGKVYKSRKYLKVHMKRKHTVLKQLLLKHISSPSTIKREEKTPNASAVQEKSQAMVIYPHETFSSVPIQVDIPHSSASMPPPPPPPPPAAYLPDMHSNEHPPRRLEEGAPNMIAESMRLITVNWW